MKIQLVALVVWKRDLTLLGVMLWPTERKWDHRNNVRLNLKKNKCKIRQKHRKVWQTFTRANTSSTRTDTTAYTTALTTGSSRTTKNECIFIRIIKVWRKMRQNYFLCLSGVFFKACITIVGKLKWINSLVSICFCPLIDFLMIAWGRSEFICLI